MSDRKYYSDGIISVEASDNGLPQCVVCQTEMARDSMAMLIRDPGPDVWMPYCRSCMVTILRSSTHGLMAQILDWSTKP